MAKLKILYAIQGTGNGHLSRATDIIPCLKKHGDVDLLVSGCQGDLPLPYDVKYVVSGLSFIFGKKGGVDLYKTVMRSHPRILIKDIKSLPVEDYDLVINDFEPVSAWACHFKKKTCISLSHQAAVLLQEYPEPNKVDRLGKFILKNYAPATIKYGFHFFGNEKNTFTPVIRKQVRELPVTDTGHYTVYLPAYDDSRLIKMLSPYKEVKWEVFSKHNHNKIIAGHITILPINNLLFTESMAAASGVLCGAGFETPAEALFLGKKLLVIPMTNQYEQHLNAAALEVLDVPVVKNLSLEHEQEIRHWLDHGKSVTVNYPDMTQEIVDLVIARHGKKL